MSSIHPSKVYELTLTYLVARMVVQYSQYSTVQYSTVQYSTVQYSTVQYSTVELLHLPRQPRLLLLRQLLQPPPARPALQHDLGALDKLGPSTVCFHIVRWVIALKIFLVTGDIYKICQVSIYLTNLH